MSKKIAFSELSLSELNSSSLIWVARFIRELDRIEGVTLKLSDEDVLGKIVHRAHQSDDELIQSLYTVLKSEIRAHLNRDVCKLRRNSQSKSFFAATSASLSEPM